MEVAELKTRKIKSIGFDNSIKGGIKEENLGFVLKSLSKNLYNNPLGSIIREICSNAYDACIAANKKPAVNFVINSDKTITIQDFGIGMDKKFIEEEYAFYGSSTKRNSKDQFGMYGMGSKSIFSITDSFIIESIKDGKKLVYTYSFPEQVNSLPELDLISEEDTTESSGTKLTFSYGNYSLWDIRIQLEEQLRYFDSVNVKGVSIQNNFNIIKYKNFVLGNNDSHRLEICFGKVRYAIPEELVKVTPRHLLNIGAALYFDINCGLVPIQSREGFHVDENALKIYKQKIEDFEIELKLILEKQSTYKTYFDYLVHYYETGRRFYKIYLRGDRSVHNPYQQHPIIEEDTFFNTNSTEILKWFSPTLFSNKKNKYYSEQSRYQHKTIEAYNVGTLYYLGKLPKTKNDLITKDRDWLEIMYGQNRFSIAFQNIVDPYQPILDLFEKLANKLVREKYKCFEDVIKETPLVKTRSSNTTIHDRLSSKKYTLEQLSKSKHIVCLLLKDSDAVTEEFSKIYLMGKGKELNPNFLIIIKVTKLDFKKIAHLESIMTLSEFKKWDFYKNTRKDLSIKYNDYQIKSKCYYHFRDYKLIPLSVRQYFSHVEDKAGHLKYYMNTGESDERSEKFFRKICNKYYTDVYHQLLNYYRKMFNNRKRI